MHAITVLAIGTNLSIALKKAWECRSFFLTLSHSPGEASSLLRNGDFDLCLVGTAVSRESRAKLASLLRHTLHSRTPVISLADDSGPAEILENLSQSKTSGLDLRRIGEFLNEIKQPASLSAGHLERRQKRSIPKRKE